LQNFWSFDNTLADPVSKCDLKIELNGALDTDRFGKVSSALFLNNGYATAPPGIYFDPATGGFTVMSWIKIASTGSFSRIIDFANGAGIDNIHFGLLGSSSSLVSTYYPVQLRVEGVTSLSLNTWIHVSMAMSKTSSKIYINGILDKTTNG